MKIKTEFKFLCLFILLLLACQGIYYFSKPEYKHFIIEQLNVSVAVKIINLISSNDPVIQKGNQICSGALSMVVATGCDGIDGLFIVISAMLAFPMRLGTKIMGTVAGIMVVYLTNLMRISGLYYTLKYKDAWFEFMHIYVGQFMVIFLGASFFFLWINSIEKKTISVEL